MPPYRLTDQPATRILSYECTMIRRDDVMIMIYTPITRQRNLNLSCIVYTRLTFDFDISRSMFDIDFDVRYIDFGSDIRIWPSLYRFWCSIFRFRSRYIDVRYAPHYRFRSSIYRFRYSICRFHCRFVDFGVYIPVSVPIYWIDFSFVLSISMIDISILVSIYRFRFRNIFDIDIDVSLDRISSTRYIA